MRAISAPASRPDTWIFTPLAPERIALVSARFMARLMSHSLGEESERRIVLVATSGDTGSAIAHAYHRLEPFEVVILFPAGKVSPRQRKQFTTLGGNVRTVAIAGTFDDYIGEVMGDILDAVTA